MDCVAFLKWALPELGLRWEGFRRVRGQVCKRIARRMRELELKDLDAYRAHLTENAGEWNKLGRLCHVTISRFYRDRGVFDRLSSDVLPVLATSAAERRPLEVRVWCAGCGAGEEVYTLALIWRFRLAGRFPGMRLSVLGTDADENQIARALAGCYRSSSLRELPEEWREMAFVRQNGWLCVDSASRESVELRVEDLRGRVPAGPYDLVLCRNVAFSYFTEPIQRETGARIQELLRVDGALVLGKDERLPEGLTAFGPWSEADRIYRRTA